MRRLFLVVCMMFLVAPFGLLAGNKPGNPPNGGGHGGRKGAAPEMPVVGLGAAAAVGVAGYLVLRRRYARQS